MRFSPSAFKVLQALATYHYLADEHFVQLGISKSTESIRRGAVTQLKQSGTCCIRDLRFGHTEFVNIGKQKYLHYLTPFGAKQTAHHQKIDLNSIWLPSGKSPLSPFKYPHRYHYISAHIKLRQWLEQSGAHIIFWEHEYQGLKQSVGQRGKPKLKTRIDLPDGSFIIPDGVFGAQVGKEHRLFLLELHHHTETNSIVQQLRQQVLNFRSIIEQYETRYPHFQLSSDPYILSIHTRKSTQLGVKAAVANDPDFHHALPGMRIWHLH